jgi:hypothetical protein
MMGDQLVFDPEARREHDPPLVTAPDRVQALQQVARGRNSRFYGQDMPHVV